MSKKEELVKEIEKLEKAINNKLVPENLKPPMKVKLEKLNEQLAEIDKEEKEEEKDTKTVAVKKRGRTKGSKNKPKGDIKPKKGKAAKKEKATKVKAKAKPDPKDDGSEPDCDELLRRYNERKAAYKKAGRKAKTTPVFKKISSDVVSAVTKAIKAVPKETIKKKPLPVIEKIQALRKSAQDFLRDFRGLLGDQYKYSEAEKDLAILEKLISEMEEKYTKKLAEGGVI